MTDVQTAPVQTVEEQVRQLLSEGRSPAEIGGILARQEIGAPYVYGAWGGYCTTAYRIQYAGYHPEYREKIYGACQALSGGKSCAGCPYRGRRAYDCRGFVRWVLEKLGISLRGEGATTQYETAANWAQRGPVSEMPELPLLCLYKHRDSRMSHTGLYVGGGETVHCSGEVKRGALDGSWTHYAVPAGLYSAAELAAANARRPPATLRRGAGGPEVKRLQEALIARGYACGPKGADGKFGAMTEAALRAFQQANALAPDGVCGPDTWAALMGESIPDDIAEEPDEVDAPDDPDAPDADPVTVDREQLMAALKTARQLLGELEALVGGMSNG